MVEYTPAKELFRYALDSACVAVGASEAPRLVARGGSSVVYRVEAGEFGVVAIKVLAFDTLAASREAAARNSLRREAEVLAAIETPFAPRLIAVDAATGYLVREFVEGTILDAVVNDPSMHLEDRLAVCCDLLEAATHLFHTFHEGPLGGFAIRDFKPRNLVRTRGTGRLVLVDVGSVRSESGMLSRSRRSHRIGSGSWVYWAPEQLLERGELLDRKVDYFALGCTLHALIYGNPPFDNMSGPASLLTDYRQTHSAISDRMQRDGRAPPALAAFTIACLSPDPAGRPIRLPNPEIARP